MRSASPESEVTCFVHIPKTAGSTVAEILRVVHGPAAVLELQPEATTAPELSVQAINPSISAVYGHIRYGLHAFTPRPFRYCTFLREPVDVVLSLYHYVLRQTQHPLHAKARTGEWSLMDCAEAAANRQIHYIAGIRYGENPPLADALAQAKENLEQRFAVFGLVERFDESMVLFKRALGWRIRSYRSMNVTSKRPGREALEAEKLAALEPYCAGDRQLYHFAAELFERRVAEQGPGFHQDVRKLQRNTRVRASISNLFAPLRGLRNSRT